MGFINLLRSFSRCGKLPIVLAASLEEFYLSYCRALNDRDLEIAQYQPLLEKFLTLVVDELENPFHFEPYHRRVLAPFDYYQFGLELMRPLVVFSSSTVHNRGTADVVSKQLAEGENVVFFANHQTEPDPQAISLLLEPSHPDLAENMIFIAGHRVISDPLAMPFSKGRNLLCIFSKKHIDNPPEEKRAKLQHNQKTMRIMKQLLSEGGNCIYVAPSGGRDRLNSAGVVELAPFHAQSIEMFWLIAQQATRPTNFYPLALSTYALLPPPSSIVQAIGERRHTQATPIHLSFGEQIDMDSFPGSEDPISDRHLKRQKRANYIWRRVKEAYDLLPHNNIDKK